MLCDIVQKEFKAYEIHKGIVILDFYLPTCGPSKMLAEVLKDLDALYGQRLLILRLNFCLCPDLVDAYKVTGYPTLIFLKDGREVQRVQGLKQKQALIKILEKWI